MAGGKGGGLGGRGNKSGSPRKGAQMGSGGQRRKSLEGKGPTPKAVDRTKHPAAKRAAAASKRVQTGGAGGGRGGRPKVPYKANRQISELIAGRNSVVEALRAEIPATTLYVATQIDIDDRVREALNLATGRALPILEVSRQEVDRLTDGAIHQGIALQIPQYTYAHPDDLIARATDAGEAPLIVALDGVTDPRNLGAVIRSAAAFGAHGVVVPERRSAGMTAGDLTVRIPIAASTESLNAGVAAAISLYEVAQRRGRAGRL